MAAKPPPEGRDIFGRKCEYNISLKGEGKYGGEAETRRARHFRWKMRVQHQPESRGEVLRRSRNPEGETFSEENASTKYA